ncbi:hypothetical protein QUF74_17505 [Candidatus Halobeggiatoa sp. HSG11]|nr:hypothetical protein [Candidatus Halobeggiatoa sp. HSG11]
MKILTISLFIMTIFSSVYAESTKFVQWWGEYIPHYEKAYAGGYTNKNSIQYQDVNGDGVYNDTVVWYGFDLNKPFNPSSYRDTGIKTHKYRTDFPSAIFYGGIIVRFTNISDIYKQDKKGNSYHPFNKLPQATVQPVEGSRPCSYATDYPNNSYYGRPDKDSRADMTLFVVEPEKWKQPISELFYGTENAEVNFSIFYLWKKNGFINGGNEVERITFDETSKLSVNMTRRLYNIEESRFIVQDGEQFWISEAKVIHNQKTDKFSSGVNGMSVNALKRGAEVQLNPLNSKWAKYNPRQDTAKIDNLVTSLKDMNYLPKTANAEEKQLYKTISDELLIEINKMQFAPQNATFVEHDFQDVQATGIYFATYTFAHEKTAVIFDNFQVYAAGKVPESKAINLSQNNDTMLLSQTDSKVSGGVSRNCGPYEQIITQCVPDNIKIKGKITVDSSDVGKQADIIAIGIHKPYPESEQETFYMVIDEGKNAEEWGGSLKNLKAFQSNIVLKPEHDLSIYQGKIPLPGFVSVLFGYRLQDGSIIYNANSIDMYIYTEGMDKANTAPYSESIKDLCP